MESIKEKLSSWLEGFQNYINSFTVIEKQNKIFYFSKYSLILSEFYQIYNFVKTLKENVFRTLIEQFKYCVKDIILFKKNLSQKEKVIILYSSCLLIYYKKFCFDVNNNFEDYYDNDFIYISSTNFGYQIINHELFKIFIFYYYSEIKRQIKSLDYNIIKNLKKYYNYKENVNNKENENNKNKNEKIKHKNSSERSTINSINNDYFPDPNILLSKNKANSNKKDYNNVNNINNNINNININNNINKINLNENEEENFEENKKININNSQQENFGLQEQVLTYLTSTKERMVDLVFEMGYKGYFPIFNNNINDRFQQFNNISSQSVNLENNAKENLVGINDIPQIPKSFNVNKNSINSINKNTKINSINSINDENQKIKSNISSFFNIGNYFFGNQIIENMDIESNKDNIKENNQKDKDNYNKDINEININDINNSFFSNDISTFCNFQSLYNLYASNTNNVNTNNNSINSGENNNNINNNKYTKRIISELSKYEVDDNIVKIIEEVAKKIDSNYLDKILNTTPKTVTVINFFSCYIVEFNSEILISIEPKYKDILKNYCIKFIVLAKELYNTTMELFTTIYDLSYTNIHTFIDLSKNCGIQIQYAESLYNMFKDYSELLLKEKEDNLNIKSILKKLFKQQKILWDKTIKEKANNFTSFVKVQNL